MKTIISLFLCLALLVGSLCSAVGAAYSPKEMDEDNLDVNHTIANDMTFSLGDVDESGTLNAMDSIAVKATVAGIEGYSCITDSADFDADGKITAIDSYYIKSCLAGNINPSDYENGYQIYKLTVGGNDISGYTVVIPEDTEYSENLYMATELLCEYVKIATGVELPIERGKKTGEHAVYFHSVDKTTEFGQSLGNEGYKYEVTEGDLHIYGTDRGNMYAVYEILEDYLGFGFVNVMWTLSEKLRVVDLEEGLSVTFVPGYRFRYSKSTFNYNNGYRERFALARGLNGIQGYSHENETYPITYFGNFVGPVFLNIHSFQYYHQMGTGTMPDESYGTLDERYRAKYSSGEWKDETKWEPCAYAESEYQILFQGLLDTMTMVTEARGYPFNYEDETHCFSFSPCDNTNWCDCRYCPKLARQTSYVDLYMSNLTNRAAEEIQEYYPGLKLYTLMYERYTPLVTTPNENLIIVLGGTSCINHGLGTDDECHGNGLYNQSNAEYMEYIDSMAALCRESGAELWLWYYPESHSWWIYDIPNIYNIYHDVTWLYDHGITGFFYEGHNYVPGYTFEHLKAYMFSQVSFNPDMTLEEYEALIKDYLWKTCGDGWEYIWEFLLMYEEAGDQVGLEFGGDETYCFVGNYNRAFDFVSIIYIQENYEYMRGLILSAIDAYDTEKTPGAESRLDRLYQLLCVFELLGLGATYVDSYINGDSSSREVYAERYAWVHDYYLNSGMRYFVWRYSGIDAPATVNLDTNPFLQFTAGSMRAGITAMLNGN